MSIIYIDSYRFAAPVSYDPDAAAYIARIEGASGDNAALETAVKNAINAFVVGCKADGIWNAIKASCILAGARTLAGALQPLAGTAPTNPGGVFVAADYNRKTGLKGNGTSKYLNSNRNNNADPQNSKHLAVYFGESIANSANGRSHIGVVASGFAQTGASIIFTDFTGLPSVDSGRYRANGSTAAVVANGLGVGLKGVSRTSSTNLNIRQGGANFTQASNSETPANANLFVFARNAILADPGAPVDNYSDARLAFYSIGESLNLELLDTRVTTLINALAAAIP